MVGLYFILRKAGGPCSGGTLTLTSDGFFRSVSFKHEYHDPRPKENPLPKTLFGYVNVRW